MRYGVNEDARARMDAFRRSITNLLIQTLGLTRPTSSGKSLLMTGFGPSPTAHGLGCF